MSARSRTLAAALVASFALAAAQASPAAAAPTAPQAARGIDMPAFYTPPGTLPQADGALVRSEPLKLALSLPWLDGKTLPGTATRLMYKTTDATGNPVAVTGAYVEPAAAWPGKGPRPLVVVAPGTMGQGDQCAASLGLERLLVIGEGTVSVGYENLATYGLLSKGVAVVITDYVGLGTPDRLHTYVNRIDQGHAVLDAARAALSVKGASVTKSSKVGLYGYSQGGGAVASAAELHQTYAPDVKLAGTFSGAAPADLAAVTSAIDGSELAGALGWSINGFVQTDPSLLPLVDKYLNDAGRAALRDLETMCVGESLLAYLNKRSNAWTTNGKSLTEIIAGEPKIQAFVDSQRIGKVKPSGPVRVATGVSDNLVPHAQSRTMAADWCARGGNVTYVPVQFMDLGSKIINHVIPLLLDQGAATNWLVDRLNGKPTGSNCRTLPLLP